ncbi:hypothetical protein [Lentzea atacamensis]|uniref:hypothetical protein n=1 Tax=Lentzea atacamensis TaxID=531938 RepID=UPI001474AF41|nr:hypothetical protein [Lentzea atacamensis]
MEYLNSSLAVTPDEEVAEAPVVTTGITDAATAQTAATRQTFLCTIFPSWPENPTFNYDRTAHEHVTAETALTKSVLRLTLKRRTETLRVIGSASESATSDRTGN